MNKHFHKSAITKIACGFIILCCESAFSQDTIRNEEVRVVTYLVKQQLFQIPAAAATIDSGLLKASTFNSLLPAMNTVPGVRMEERSPGSYRLSVRGSLLRSPFGIRNVKIYFDEFALTDAGGNTYLNTIAPEAINRVEVLKGPDGSMFGANSGGVITLLSPAKKNKFSAAVTGGSFNLFKQDVTYAHNTSKNDFTLTGSYYKNNGYREHSRMRRFYLQAKNNFRYSDKNEINVLFFRSNLYYQTPGGLNETQFKLNPAQARQATATLPGAAQQQAAVYNDMIFGGITHQWDVSARVKHVVAVSTSSVDFKNPFITNFERRKETSIGARTYFVADTKNQRPVQWHLTAGAELQQIGATINNYQNIAGNSGRLIASGNIQTQQHFLFTRAKVTIVQRLITEAGISINYYRYRFTDSFVLRRMFTPQWMPRFALSYAITKNLVVRSSVSKGYSPPTTAETRPSDNRLNATLQPETGFNTEAGARYFSADKRLWADLSLYNYQLRRAIVQQQNDNGEEFFVNAGGTSQQGIELQSSYLFVMPYKNNRIQKLVAGSSAAYSAYRFKDFVTTTGNFNGNAVTGVPRFTMVTYLQFEMRNSFFLFIQHNHSSSLPLNDANTVYASSFDVLQIKTGFTIINGTKHSLQFILGVDNVSNERYSLGHDLNAAGNRYYNAAPVRNYFASMVFNTR